MRIAHYFLGFPPYRTGGLTKYAYDLMISQREEGNELFAFWPGRISPINRRIYFKETIKPEGIISIEIINSLPVSLDEGIKAVDAYTKGTNKNEILEYLRRINPDVIHIHTLMGLHKEFVDAAKSLNIKTIYTTHDYFGICPKVTLYRNGETCDNDQGCQVCIMCNIKALSLRKIELLQSPLYRNLKNSNTIRALRKRHRQHFFEEDETWSGPKGFQVTQHDAAKYRELRAYYKTILETIDLIHFNSSLTKEVFERYISPNRSTVISITHKNVKDNRQNRSKKWNGKLSITCLAPARPYKGFDVLRSALDELWEEGKRFFELRVYSPVKNPAPYMIINEDGFNQSELQTIFGMSDVLIAPSIWYETFGFTVLEALSYGVPVIVSDHMGSKDIIGSAGIVISAGNVCELKDSIISMYESKCAPYAHCVNDNNIVIKSWDTHVKELTGLYQWK
ncbi:MAG: glycosyltransferase [Oscillospiraceae bacterium]|nr:glycosyltransferase [Oscillospiraceae bacterium]